VRAEVRRAGWVAWSRNRIRPGSGEQFKREEKYISPGGTNVPQTQAGIPPAEYRAAHSAGGTDCHRERPRETRQPNRAYDRRMMDANYVSERLTSLKQEMRDLQDFNARHCTRNKHTALDKSARTSRQERLLQIKRELSDMLKRCA